MNKGWMFISKKNERLGSKINKRGMVCEREYNSS